jgi:DNA polymerase I-like protein with 3'-5' exonuclease and polymerase domains
VVRVDLSIAELIDQEALALDLPEFLAKPEPEMYLSKPFIVVDFETTNLEYGNALNPNNRLVCAAWACSYDMDVRYKYGDEFSQHQLLRDTQRVLDDGGFIIAHNAKFELHWYSRMGLDLYSAVTYDTMLGEYVRGGNRWMFQHLSLDKLNKKYGGTGKMSIVDGLIKGGVCPSDIPEDLLKARVTKDICDTYHVFAQQIKILEKRKQLPVVFTRNLATPCLTWIEQRGLALNKDRVYEEYERSFASMQELQQKLDKFTGGINWRSSIQKAQFLYGTKNHEEEALRFPGLGFPEPTKYGGKKVRNKKSKAFPDGAPKTDDKTLAKLKAKTKRQERFLRLLKEAGKINAELTKTLEFFKGVCDEYDGTFYGAFNQYNTQTHRLSSSGKRLLFAQYLDASGNPKGKSVQFQNFPRKFKDLMCPKTPGRRMGEIDGSQLEFRVAAFLGRDLQAIMDIRGDVDIHLFTASILNSCTVDEVTKALRQAAKEHTFKPLYGGQSGTPEQVAYYTAFREKYHELFDTQTSWTYDVLNDKKLRTQWGMEYHWPNTRMSKDGYIDNTPSIFNYPVQAFATAEIIPVALVYLWHRLARNGAETEIVNTVHDSAIGEVAPGEEALWCRLGVQCFTTDVYTYLDNVYGIQFDVPLGAGITIGDRWASPDGTECEINVEPDGSGWFKGSRGDDPTDYNERAWESLCA